MFSRELQQQLSGYFSSIGTNAQRTINTVKGLLILIQIILGSLVTVKGLWDNGFGQRVDALADNNTAEPTSGYTKRWWKTAQAIFNIYAVTMKMPIGTFSLLAVTDGQGNLVLDADDNPITPFALFDPANCGDLAQKTIEQISWMEPEIPSQPEPEIIDEPVP